MTTSIRTLSAQDIDADWVKSSYSDNGTACVEAADLTRTDRRGVAVRDSKDPDGPALLFTPEMFAAFVADVRGGRFDV
ncbi:DUF397 domain-containing protein [Streptomyces sp. MAR4 CNX-425]|uniref:DUF397 domain-containing protein n=1 Tax=Streptomyces sp. MAR4 CNX-425 TaxID=3406343 RepID=UPI003B50A01E